MIKTAIILAGGFGTRLQSVVSELPKPMAPVAGRPFLEYLLDYAGRQGIERAVLCVGYKRKVIQDHFRSKYKDITIEYAVEEEPLGTGGAIWNAFPYCENETVVVLNGDSLFEVDIPGLFLFKKEKKADMALSLKPMRQFDRYGVVELDEKRQITTFREKTYCEEGLINGGVYAFDLEWARQLPLSGRFSFEKEVLEQYVRQKAFFGYVSEGYFIDIGIPEDYRRAQTELPNKILDH